MNKEYKRGIRDTIATITLLVGSLSIFAIWILR